MIKYLLKFVSKEKYADDLLGGKLFMRPGIYYRRLEVGQDEGQNDLGEFAISHEICMYMHSTVPIYCMYAVKDTDIIDGKNTIPSRCIKDFKCEQGFIVKIDFLPFEKMLPLIQSNGYMVCAGLVNYHHITEEETFELMLDNSLKNLFIKRPGFFYQKEFRIAVGKQVYKLGETPIDHKEYYFQKGLGEIATKIEVAKVQKKGEDYILIV